MRTLLVLHPCFALTGILLAVNGPLLPSMASAFQLDDTRSGTLLFLFFMGTSIGALLCRGNYARLIAYGFAALALTSLCVAFAPSQLIYPAILAQGVALGVPLSAVSLYVGRNFEQRCAATLTLLNFTWAGGALVAPLLAAPILTHHGYQFVYLLLACLCAVAAIACAGALKDAPEAVRSAPQNQGSRNMMLILLFAFLAFVQVGIENTALAWLATYALRSTGSGWAVAAASSSIYWCGFLASRGVSSYFLLRVAPFRVLGLALPCALLAAIVLSATRATALGGLAMFVLGASLAPVFPLLVSIFMARARHTSDARWLLAFSGMGGSALPWLTGWISTRSGSLRMGLATVPLGLLLMVALLPLFNGKTGIKSSK